MESLALMVSSSVNAGTVLALAALGLLINERAGVINLGAEGMMLIGALAAYATAAHGHGAVAASPSGAAGGALAAAVFGLGVIWLGTNQYATGLALSLFGSGFTAFAGIRLHGAADRRGRRPRAPGSCAICPSVGRALFHYHPIVYLDGRAGRRARLVLLSLAGRAWCCARPASRPSRPTRSDTRCGGCGSTP